MCTPQTSRLWRLVLLLTAHEPRVCACKRGCFSGQSGRLRPNACPYRVCAIIMDIAPWGSFGENRCRVDGIPPHPVGERLGAPVNEHHALASTRGRGNGLVCAKRLCTTSSVNASKGIDTFSIPRRRLFGKILDGVGGLWGLYVQMGLFFRTVRSLAT